MFLNNSSNDVGGGLCAYGSKVYIIKSIQIEDNRAKQSGGGVYLYRSSFICARHCSVSKNRVMNRKSNLKGGGIYAFDSKIILGNKCTDSECASESIKILFLIKDNYAKEGGGMYLEANSMLLIPKDIKYKLIFLHNQATKGGVMYINDDTYLGTCNELYVQCFLQVSLPIARVSDSQVLDSQIRIIGKVTKNTLFGGLLDKCFINDAFSGGHLTKGIDYLKTMTSDQNISRMITSKAVRVQFCRLQSTTMSISIKKGENFNVQVVALDQVNHSVKASISSRLNLPSIYSHLEDNQHTQPISAKCTNLSFNIHSLNDSETLYISPESQCSNKENGRALHVHITFEECTCPMGFYVLRSRKYIKDCKCACDRRISPYAELSQCNLSSVVRKNGCFIGYSNDTGFLVHPFCPYDFCLPPTTPDSISIDLKLRNGSDTQCASNRAGLLCGKCKPGYSLSLSSSHCLKCPEINWPWALLIITVNIIAGVVLVVTILVLNLTVSIGTLNGLIFYANVFAADSNLFLSFTEQNFFTVFLAWLNLDLGIDVCYFKGIDAYTKAWLDIMFPIYVIAVLVLIIIISRCSSRFGAFIGRWNPVATLATLLLLSYTKLLRAVITILSVTVITYLPSNIKDGEESCI